MAGGVVLLERTGVLGGGDGLGDDAAVVREPTKLCGFAFAKC